MFKQNASLQNTQRSVSRIMWSRLFLVFLVGAASAKHFRAWKTDTEYEFNVRSRTLSSLHKVANEYTGIVLRARLTVRPKSEETLEAKVWKAQYAQIHGNMSFGWKADILDNELNLKHFPISEKVFEIKMKNGIIRNLIVEHDVQNWELNVLKSIVSQLQVDTQGENLIAWRYNQEPVGDRNNAMFKTMEDSVGGKCEVLYKIRNLPRLVVQLSPELVPIPKLRHKGMAIEIVKTKNYTNCEQRMTHYFDITGSNRWESGTNGTGKFMSRSSASRIVITGNPKTFTIQSSVTTNEVRMSPSLHENQKGMVGSLVNVTLAKVGPVSSGPWSTPTHPASTGNLVYSFDSPIAVAGEDRSSTLCRSSPDNSEEQPRGYYLKFKRQTDDDDDSSAFLSSKNASSLQSDEDQSYWQPGSTLNDPPTTPLLPFFDRSQVRSINKSKEVDLVAAAKRVASQIGSDLENPNSITDEQTLEKFTILARLIRTMNTKQIAEVQNEVYQSENEMDPQDASQSVRSNTWAAFRDAVAQAGTGPALVTIKNWIKEKKVEGPEAASVVGALSQTARTPIPEYMDAFFELATMPETTNQEILNSTAMITFAELVRFSQVNHHSTHNRCAGHSFNNLSSKRNPAIFRDYVPYMSEQLKKSIENKEAAKSHVFIRALGNIAHRNILTIFEPYLQGTIPASTFQRTLIVFSMTKLASLRPRVAHGVLYRIYQNATEAHQVRCAAAIVLMSTNPPRYMLRRMAKVTNSDYSKHVNAVVKSAIESASELRSPEHQVLAQKARDVRFRLNKDSYGRKYSTHYFWDYTEKRNIAHQSQAYFGSDDSFVPQAFYVSMKAIYGDFQAPKPELAAMVSSVEELYRELQKRFEPHNKKSKGNHQEIQFSTEDIAKLLKIENDDEEDLEGVLWMKSKYENRFMSFDKHSIRHIPELLKKAAASLKEGRNFNMAKLDSYDLALSFPMESGFPFVYTLKVPALLKASGSVKGENTPNAVQGSIDLRLVYSMQVQARLGFVTPFGHQHYMAGLNKNLQLYVPIHAEIKYEKSEKQVTLKIQSIEQNEENKVMHYSIVPFVSRYNILDLLPVTKDDQTHKLRSFDPTSQVIEYGARTRGINFKLEIAPTEPFVYRNGWGWDLPGDVTFPFAEEDIVASRTELTMIPSPSSEQSVILTGSFQTLEDYTTKYDENRSNSSFKENALKIKSKKLNDPERRSELLKEVAQGIAAADGFAMDFGLELPGQEPLTCIMTMAFAKNDSDEKFRGSTYWSCTDGCSQNSMELCAGLEGKGPRSSVSLDSEKASSPSRSFNVDIRFGDSCEEGYKVQFNGKQEQTDEYKKALHELPAVVECMKEIKSGVKSVPACLEARAINSTMDKSRIIIKLDPEIGVDEALRSQLRGLAYSFPQLQLIYHDAEAIDNNTVIVSMNLVQTKPEYKANISIKMADLCLAATDADIDQFAVLVTNAHPDLSANDHVNVNSDDDSSKQHMCVVDRGSTTTFDKVTYPVELGKCWHVAMRTYLENNKHNNTTEQIDEDTEVSVVVRDAEENTKQAKIVLGKDQLKLTSNGSKVHVQLNGKTIDFSEKHSSRQKIYGDLDFDIMQRADGSITLFSFEHHVAVTYDRERVQIEASGKYRNHVRGLCGNYDGAPANDFTSPKNCVLSKPEQFVGSYAITSCECQAQALQNARKANEADCIRNTVRPGDVVSDSEAGRSGSEKNNWVFHNNTNSNAWNQGSHHRNQCTIKRTKVIEELNEICFSLRPVPTCPYGSILVTTKLKVTPMYCMPRGGTAQQMVHRIEEGANFDFSRKKPSKRTYSLNVPVICPPAFENGE